MRNLPYGRCIRCVVDRYLGDLSIDTFWNYIAMKIYTRTGDKGQTRLFDGTKVLKNDMRVEAYGNVDELNATIGCALAFTRDSGIRDLLQSVQRDLLSLGAQLADPHFDTAKFDKATLCAEWVLRLEKAMDELDLELPPLRSFILPGGGQCGALLHIARTVCRRAERSIVTLNETVSIDPKVVEYLNRLSDLLFVVTRVVNHREGEEEVQW